MDPSAAILATAAGLGFVSAIGLAVYALVLRRQMAKVQDQSWFLRQANAQIVEQSLEDAEALKAQREQIADIKAQLTKAHLLTGALYEQLAETRTPGAGRRLDALMFPDADADAVAAGDGVGPLPDRRATAATGAEADLVSEVRPARTRTGDLL